MTIFQRIRDFDSAYANAPNIPGAEAFVDGWPRRAQAYREAMASQGRLDADIAYGDGARQRYDLFKPLGASRGLAVFIHGGYWMRFDKSMWSHLAAGMVERGWTVVLPSYTLCPEIRIGGIVDEVATAIAHAASRIDGPIRLAGHSAGGHLATRMVAAPSPLPDDVLSRISGVVSISGVHDLRPLMRTALNDTLKLDAEEARLQSPALLEPAAELELTCWVGACERSEFVRQNALLASAWRGVGLATRAIEEADRHHFDVVDGLEDASHELTGAFAGA